MKIQAKLLSTAILFFSLTSSKAQIIKAVTPDKIYTDVYREIKSMKRKTVVIGQQTWMTENLDVKTFKNGDPIMEANGAYKWQQAGLNGTPAWCYANESHPEWGKMYNSFAVNDPRGIAPDGWHVPTVEEWNSLYEYLGGNNEVLNKISSKAGWSYPSPRATNSTGLTLRPIGRRSDKGSFYNQSDRICLWAANDANGCEMFMFSDITSNTQNRKELIDTRDCREGAEVRLIKD